MNDAMRRGTDLEPTIVKWAHRHLEEVYGGRWWVEYEGLPNWSPTRTGRCYSGSMDALAHSKDATWLIEAKTGKHAELLTGVPVALRRPSPVVPRGVRPRPRPARGVRRDG